ncbi:hypothetical protein XENOCAPTIV_005866 [Xenoophorus captivus]|uniref:PiggyBac transposable element-derived protein domain-containing protein n=1 Tax=Xenoophorus captivus TaxID=1517983 RepID=A0ABV0Q4G8_9TELE
MGGVDLYDRMISFYPMPSHYTTIMHVFDLAATNSWIECRSDHQVSGKPERKKLQDFDIKLLLADKLIAQAQGSLGQQADKVASDDDERSNEDEDYIPNTTRRHVEPPPNDDIKNMGLSICQRC